MEPGAHLEPVAANERIETMDVLRGFFGRTHPLGLLLR